MKKLLYSLVIIFSGILSAQNNIPNPYESIGKPAPQMATLTNGKYDEFLIKEPLVLINGDAVDRKTGELIYTKEENPQEIEKLQEQQEEKFRFLSVDPLAENFAFWTPYQYAGNSPIMFIDMDGAEVAKPTMPGLGIATAYNAEAVASAIKEHPNSSTLKLYAMAFKNLMAALGMDIVALSDVNDAVILGTTTTRGSAAIDVNGKLTTPLDRKMAVVGAAIPLVSGSFVGKIIKAFDKMGGDKVDNFLKAGKYGNWTDFYDKTRKLSVNDRIAEFKKAGAEVADNMGWSKDNKLSKKFGRDVYTDSDKNIFSLDTRHGEFEVLNSKGKHQGAVSFEGKQTKVADTTGKHDLDVK